MSARRTTEPSTRVRALVARADVTQVVRAPDESDTGRTRKSKKGLGLGRLLRDHPRIPSRNMGDREEVRRFLTGEMPDTEAREWPLLDKAAADREKRLAWREDEELPARRRAWWRFRQQLLTTPRGLALISAFYETINLAFHTVEQDQHEASRIDEARSLLPRKRELQRLQRKWRPLVELASSKARGDPDRAMLERLAVGHLKIPRQGRHPSYRVPLWLRDLMPDDQGRTPLSPGGGRPRAVGGTAQTLLMEFLVGAPGRPELRLGEPAAEYVARDVAKWFLGVHFEAGTIRKQRTRQRRSSGRIMSLV